MCGIDSKLSNAEFVNFISQYDIACLSETFLTKDLDTSIFKDHVEYASKAKKLSHHGRYSGGATILVRKHLSKFVDRVAINVDNFVALKLDKKLMGTEKDVVLISLYIPPYDSNYWKMAQDGHGIELLEKCVLDLHDSLGDFLLLICGDFNARTADRNINFSLSDDIEPANVDNLCDLVKRKSQDTVVNHFGEQLLEFCNIFDCLLLNGLSRFNFDDSFTYVSENGSSVVDYYVCSFEMFTKLAMASLTIKDMVESDHLPVGLSIYIDRDNAFPSQPRGACNQKSVYMDKLIWQRERETEFRENISLENNVEQLNLASSNLETNVEDALLLFNDCIKNAAQCMVRKCNVSGNRKNAVWYDQECKEAKVNCRKKLKSFRKCMKDATRRKMYVDSRKQYKSIVKQKKQEFRKNTADLLKNSLNNSEVFWKELRKIGGCKKSTLSDVISLEDWYEHFKNVYKQCEERVNDDSIPENDMEDEKDHRLNAAITKDEVRKAVMNLNSGKAGGTDGIVPEMLKCGGDAVIEFLTKLFNKIFDSGIYPNEWAKAIVVPIFKKGDANQPDNYRGISLINTACKCYTSILNKRLYSWLEESEIILENQAGFRRNYSTSDQIFNLYTVIQKCMNKSGQKVYIAFVDFKKAFDSVNHEKLLEAVYKEGVRGKFFGALKVMYESLVSCVRVNHELSDIFECPVGVRQGCVLSPTLFSLFINELANYISENGVHGVQLLPNLLELFILLFADDVTLISTTPGGLQAQLNSLKLCCDKLKLTVNKDKTKVMVFRKGGFLGDREKWFFEGSPIEVVNKYCYLGFTFTTMLSFNLGTSHLVAKGKKAVYLICRAFQNCREMSPETFFRIFDSKVQSILLYSSEIWGYQRLECIEKVHMLACKRFLGVPLKTPNKMVYGELGRFPLYINSTVRCLKYWFRLLQMDPQRLPKQAYAMLILQDQNGKRCWATEIRELLFRTGFGFVWMNQGVQDIGGFLKVVKQRLLDMFMQEWSSTIRNKERYIMYSIIKDDFGKAAYIQDVSIYCFRVAMSQIRFGVLPINNNMNRYGENPRSSMCHFCQNQIEDEKHFMFACPLYTDLRNIFLENYESHQLYRMIEGKHIGLSRSVAKYIFHAIKRRQQFIDNN